MSARKTAHFIAEVELQYEWYAAHAGWEMAERYLAAIEATCALIAQHPQVGPVAGFNHPRLDGWRLLVVARPFHRHVIFFDVSEHGVVVRRAMHGHRDLPRRLREEPGTS